MFFRQLSNPQSERWCATAIEMMIATGRE